jgi:hypothetical protein
MSDKSTQIYNPSLSSLTDEDWNALRAMGEDWERHLEENPPDLIIVVEPDIEGIDYYAENHIYRGAGSDPDEHYMQSALGYWQVNPPLLKGLGEEELRAWTVQTMQQLCAAARDPKNWS